MHIKYAMIFVSDMAEATAFYRDVVGLPLKFESPGWTEFSMEHSVTCVQEPKMQFGARLAQYGGPDGLVFSIGEAREG